MATTPIYGFVTPDLASTADGPAATAALALRVEREMATLRATNEYTVTSTNCPSGATTVVHNVTVPTSVIGWLDVDVYWYMHIPGIVNSITSQVAAGTITLLINDVVTRTIPWHTLWSTRMYTGTIRAAIARTAAHTTTNLKLRVSVNSGDPAMTFAGSVMYVTQIGAPGTG